jgi:hypothetical protein
MRGALFRRIRWRTISAADDFMPTTLDLLRLEMLYPTSHTYPIGCGVGCFYGTGSDRPRVWNDF